MDDEKKSIAASQWSIGSAETAQESIPPPDTDGNDQPETKHTENNMSDSIKKRGFFESISHGGSSQKKLEALIRNYELQARDQINDIETLYDKKIQHLQNRKDIYLNKIDELQQKILLAEQYDEANDEQLQKLLLEKKEEEEKLLVVQQQITDIRIRLGEAKAGIINKSLDEAENQVRKALNIHNLVYDEVRKINRKKFEDGQDYLARLSTCYQDLLQHYTNRYEKVNRHLRVLDADAISPITTAILTTIGTISFGAAGFFFSTFASHAGFGNQDMLYFILDGLIKTAQRPVNDLTRIIGLLCLIILVTLVSFLCNFLIRRLKQKQEEEIFTNFSVNAQASGKLEQIDYQMNINSNNWYAFWLQLVPGIFIIGLVILSLSQNYDSADLSIINASSEGFVAGISLAMALAGLIYLYIIKIVEPRLLDHYEVHADKRVNWVRVNWELVMVILVFVFFSSVILIQNRTSGILQSDEQINYAIFLFLAISLVGSMSFAYSVRSRGLIQTGRYLENGIKWLNKAIAYCSAPQTPDVYHTLAPEHGNVLEHVLKQLSFKAAVNFTDGRVRTKGRRSGFFGELMDALKTSKKKDEQDTTEHLGALTVMEPWEEKYFPHIVDELKAKEFEYKEKRSRLQEAIDNINDHRADRTNGIRSKENEIALCRENIKECETQIETALFEKAERIQNVRTQYDDTLTRLLDGFHLGMWYKENGMGPIIVFKDPIDPDETSQYNLLTSQ